MISIRKWVKDGMPLPAPPYFKQMTVKNYSRRYLPDIFIETGTFKGNMVHAIKKEFKNIYSIELDEILYKIAKKRFVRNNHISIIQGDSAVQLHKILTKNDKPCLFWLDAHYSGEGQQKVI